MAILWHGQNIYLESISLSVKFSKKSMTYTRTLYRMLEYGLSFNFSDLTITTLDREAS